jgi:hypothetical protein
MNKKGQLAGWEALIIIILIGYSGYMTYLWAVKPSMNSVYNSGSNPNVHQPTYSPHFGCVNVKVDEEYEKRLQDVITNKTHS